MNGKRPRGRGLRVRNRHKRAKRVGALALRRGVSPEPTRPPAGRYLTLPKCKTPLDPLPESIKVIKFGLV